MLSCVFSIISFIVCKFSFTYQYLCGLRTISNALYPLPAHLLYLLQARRSANINFSCRLSLSSHTNESELKRIQHPLRQPYVSLWASLANKRYDCSSNRPSILFPLHMIGHLRTRRRSDRSSSGHDIRPFRRHHRAVPWHRRVGYLPCRRSPGFDVPYHGPQYRRSRALQRRSQRSEDPPG